MKHSLAPKFLETYRRYRTAFSIVRVTVPSRRSRREPT